MVATKTYYTTVVTDWGYVGLLGTNDGVYRLTLPQDSQAATLERLCQGFPDAQPRQNLMPAVQRQIRDYFAGRAKQSTDDVPIPLPGFTAFSRKVLQACRDIPAGQTRTYGELAGKVGSPRAARAVGAVMARNPVPLLIPCHRVVGAKGQLTGFTAPGGIDMKQRMLDHEK